MTDTTNMKEISINKPSSFTGDRTKVRGFVQDCRAYLQLNKHIYTIDEAKIAFVLSFLSDGESQKWKETYMATLLQDTGEFKYPTFQQFMTIFVEYFRPMNMEASANAQMATLKQGKRTVEELVAEFRLLASRAGMTSTTASDHIHLINHFQRALHPAIGRKIALSDSVPTTIEGWAERAIQYDTNYRVTIAMYGTKPGGRGDLWGRTGSSSSNQRDPNAMEVDAMTMDKRTTLMKQGLCFKCEERGHLARDCKKKKKRDMKGIHALLTALSKEEKEELLALQGGSKDSGSKDADF
jgi:hypothetical protein